MRARIASFLVIAFASLSCLGDDESDHQILGDDGVHPVVEAECDFLERCAPEALQNFPGGTRSACIARGEALYQAASAQYSIADAEGCARWMEQKGCALRVSWPVLTGIWGATVHSLAFPVQLEYSPELRQFCSLVGPDGSPLIPAPPDARAGAACSFTIGCGESLVCIVDDPLRKEQGTFCGHCRERVAPGSPCEAQECALGSYCIDGVCSTFAAPGAPCNTNATCENTCVEGKCLSVEEAQAHYLSLVKLGSACSGARDCGPLMACVAQQCVRRPDVGGTCASMLDCREGLVCSGAQGSLTAQPTTGTCAQLAPAQAAPEGQGCDGISAFCASGLACFNNQCKRAAEGDPCLLTCAEGLYCAGGMGFCTRKRAPGEPCSNGGQCTTENCVDNDTTGCELTATGAIQCQGAGTRGERGVCGGPPGADACLGSN